ncbi:LacI family DNA-binding transcriptional regulator [Pseudogemmobacter sp. W21_MBD1_M6]|uniref:LacI family DNA-binding transcriptional regulator n=1 Tax=Pseudogemmobacter sp. W21_MBD1_M6 TaxID=3240271 RepID=UPI003F9CA038
MTDALRKKRITAQDIALRAGVSRSAVSRAFTDGAYIDPDKRARVLQAAHELGYRPNALAAGLKGARSNLVAIFVGQMPNEYDKEVVAELVMGLNSIGKWPIVIGGTETAAREAVSNVLRYPLEAMILRSGSLDEDIVNACGKLSIPVISSGRVLRVPGVDNICCRNKEGMALGTHLLLDRGRRRFGFIGGPQSFASSNARRAGLVETLHSADLELLAEETGRFTVQSGYEAAHRLVQAVQIDALVCANDAMAIGALSALRERGRVVPDDISVIGFDDISMAAWPAFALTTLRNPIEELVTAVLGLLARRTIAPDKPDETIYLDANLVLRNSH